MTQTRNSSTLFFGDWFKQWTRSETWLAWLFVLPSLIGYLVFFAWPALRGVYFSFTNYDLLSEAKWVGLDNYAALLGDEQFGKVIWATVYYVLLNIPIQTALAVLIAVLMDRVVKSLWFRGAMLIPWIVPNVIVALTFQWVLDPQLGMLNYLLSFVGLDGQKFLGSTALAMPSIAGINIWRHAGYTALLLFSGLQTIPKELYEAAAIDGASERRAFWSVTLPLMRPVLAFVLVTTVIGSFQVFDTIAVTTKGGPVDATRVLMFYVYEYGFSRFKMGFAAAVSMVLFAILLIITIIQLRFLRANESDLN
jgi:multiple sugar transport system permease protein